MAWLALVQIATLRIVCLTEFLFTVCLHCAAYLEQGLRTIELTAVGNVTSDAGGTQSMTYNVGSGVGSGWTLRFTVGGQLANVSSPSQQEAVRFSFLAPSVESMSASTGLTAGGYNITVFGLNFGTAQDFAALGVYVNCDVLVVYVLLFSRH